MIEIYAVVAEDTTKNIAAGEPYYPPGGGVVNKPTSFNVRTVALRPVGAPDGELTAESWSVPQGLILIDAAPATQSLAGQRLKITLEPIELLPGEEAAQDEEQP